MPSKKNRKKARLKAAAAASSTLQTGPIVGPDYIQLLRGTLPYIPSSSTKKKTKQQQKSEKAKEVAIILCGESHQDAIDVTRSKGIFEPREGWIDTSITEIATDLNRFLDDDDEEEDLIKHQIWKIYNKPLPLEKAKEWAINVVQQDVLYEVGHGAEIVLVWFPPKDGGGTNKGRAAVLSFEAVLIEDDDEGSESEDEKVGKTKRDFWKMKKPKRATSGGGGGGRQSSAESASSSSSSTSISLDIDHLATQIRQQALYILNKNNNTDTTAPNSNTANNDTKNNNNKGKAPQLFMYTDLDTEARNLSRLRLYSSSQKDDEVTTKEYDALIEKRKKKLREKETLWTFDDWFTAVGRPFSSSSSSGGGGITTTNGDAVEKINKPAVHMVLESSIPPWEVELHRPPKAENDPNNSSISMDIASDYIRCISEDSEGSDIDDHDPSSDGLGSYIDFMYRRLMKEQTTTAAAAAAAAASSTEDGKEADETKKEEKKEEGKNEKTEAKNDQSYSKEPPHAQWLHCVDSRDLGCEHATVAESLHSRWMDLLLPEEQKTLFGGNHNHDDDDDDDRGEKKKEEEAVVHAHYKGKRCLPEWMVNPEDVELKRLKQEGLLQNATSNDDDDDSDDEDEKEESNHEEDLVTFPSFELFFGQNTDILYYDPHVKVRYGPFLANCVGSLENWENFFSNLFFGGTIADAISTLRLSSKKNDSSSSDSLRKHTHIRSPILKSWDIKTGTYKWYERNDDEMDVTVPFLPTNCHLKAKNSVPARTWSSQIYATLQQCDIPGYSQLASMAKSWALEDIKRHLDDPKDADDEHGGGEWFLAWLRSAHRDIYDDIDRSDPTELLKRKFMAGESDGKQRKHKIGDIKVPSGDEGFNHICSRFGGEYKNDNKEEDGMIMEYNPAETMAKIIVDIYMSKLIDFSTILKIAEIVAAEEEKSSSDQVVIVCYMGSVHTRAIEEFYCSKMGFKKKQFVGKLNWEEGEARALHLSDSLWNFQKLF